jgi:hypothetical protein
MMMRSVVVSIMPSSQCWLDRSTPGPSHERSSAQPVPKGNESERQLGGASGSLRRESRCRQGHKDAKGCRELAAAALKGSRYWQGCPQVRTR